MKQRSKETETGNSTERKGNRKIGEKENTSIYSRKGIRWAMNQGGRKKNSKEIGWQGRRGKGKRE